MKKAQVLLSAIFISGLSCFALAIPSRLRGGATVRLLETAPHMSIDLIKKMNEVGRVRGQFQTFYDPYVESEQGTPRRQLLIDRKQLQAEAIDLHHRVQRLKDDLRKDAENVRGLLAKLKQCHENGNAEAAGRQHEVQLVIWKVGDVLSQVEDVLKRDDETYGHLNLEKPTEQP